MKEIIHTLVVAMEAKKVEEGVSPTHITMTEINQVLKISLRQLVDGDLLKLGKTINEFYVKSIDPK
jgi:hypothetical protein